VKQKLILVVEDDPLSGNAIQQTLAKALGDRARVQLIYQQSSQLAAGHAIIALRAQKAAGVVCDGLSGAWRRVWTVAVCGARAQATLSAPVPFVLFTAMTSTPPGVPFIEKPDTSALVRWAEAICADKE
jgi:hypothetical protein